MNSEDSNNKKIIPIANAGSDEVNGGSGLYAATHKIYPRSVEGIFAYWRWIFVWITQIIFYGLPWIEWGSRQAVLFDLETRRFYIFGLVLYPQDFIYLTGLLVISALALFLFTAVAGRLWCGFACPQTVYTEIFLWIERQIEGDRGARIKLDDGHLSAEKMVKKTYKHVVWIFFSIWTGFTFVGFFTPIRELLMSFFHTTWGAWETFWVFFYALATYGNAGFMREQVCKYMCPYARFQSAMFDSDTLIVTYDSDRGEPRGARSKKADMQALQLGSCVDCTLCVQVCPTGIDIRNGLQYECIGCGACIDVCDGVMDKMGYERGLIRFSTENALDNRWSPQQMWRRVLRPRVQIYTMIWVALIAALFISLGMRTPFKVDVVRDRAALARLTEEGTLENVFRIQIMNASEQTQTYQLILHGLPHLRIETEAQVQVDPAQARWVVLRADIPYGSVEPGSHKIQLEVRAMGSDDYTIEDSVFIVPR